MAAQLITNPLIFHPGDPQSAAFFTGKMKITQVEFSGYLNATDVCEVQTVGGNTIWYADGRTDLDTVRSGKIGWVDGLKVPVTTTNGKTNIPSGQVLVYFE
jgi:hypothetical protein